MKNLLLISALIMLFSCSANLQTSRYEKIEFEAGPCYGFCPIYTMTINADRSAVLLAKQFNFSRERNLDNNEGTFKTTIKLEDYQKLIVLLSQADLKNAKVYYGNSNVSDLPTSYLTINYKDGRTQKIEDYGKHGTPELENVYQFFEELKLNQNWIKVE